MRSSPARVALALALMAAGAAPSLAATLAAPPVAGASVRFEPLKQLFPLLDLYYRIDPARRTRFQLAYRLHSGERAAPARAWLVEDSTALPISPDGWFERLPTAEELAGGGRVGIETPTARFRVTLVPEMTGAGKTVMDAATIVAAVDQLEAQVHGRNPVGLLVPHFGRVLFRGGRGAMIIADSGETHAAPLQHGQPVSTLQSLRLARYVSFEVAPERVLILPN